MPAPDFERELLDRLQAIVLNGAKKTPSTAASDPTETIETVDTTSEPESVGAIASPSRVNFNNIFHHPDAHPIVLDLLLLKKYGPEWMGWETETVEMRIPEDFKTSVSEANINKIHAVNALHLVDSFWERWEVFLPCVMSFNGIIPNFDMMQVPSIAQVLVAIDVANRIRDDMTWSTEIKHFIESVYRHDGVFFPVPPADFVTLDTKDYPLDIPEIAKRWTEVRASQKAPTDETVTGEQLRRLLIITNYLEESRDHLRQQLPLVSYVNP